jgi:hypothetical protein
VAHERSVRTEPIVAFRVEIDVVDAEQKRIEGLPTVTKRADLNDGI